MSKLTEFERELIERHLDLDIETTQVFNMIGNYNSLKRLAQGLYKRVQLLERALKTMMEEDKRDLGGE